MTPQTLTRAAATPAPDSSDKPDSSAKRHEAEKFSNALVRTKAMLQAFADLLAEVGDSADADIAKIDDFIQHKARNGVADYATDFDTVLSVQQAMQLYQLLYWNAFYAVKVVENGKPVADGPSFVIAATLDAAQPVHVGIGRDQVIEPGFKSLILSWSASAVQTGHGKLIFNLVPDAKGVFQRTFTGSWVLENGTAQTVFGVQSTPKDDAAKDQQKFSLPPALQVIYPTISALGSIAGVIGGVVGMLWIRKQWREKNAAAARAEAEARANPQNQDLQQQARDAVQQAEDVQGVARQGGADLARQGGDLQQMPDEQFDQAVQPVADDAPPLPDQQDVDQELEAAQNEADNPDLQEAAEALAEEIRPPDVQGGGEEEAGGLVEPENGALGPVAEGE